MNSLDFPPPAVLSSSYSPCGEGAGKTHFPSFATNRLSQITLAKEEEE